MASLMATGCSSLRYEDDDGSPPGKDPVGEPECVVDPAAVLELSDVESATLFGDTLHLEGRVEGESAYAVVELAASHAELVAIRPELAGSAHWTLAREGYYVRVLGSRLDVLEASEPTAASVVSSLELGAPPAPDFEGIGADADAVFLCLPAPADGAPILSRVDLADPLAPGAPSPISPPSDWAQPSYPCTQFGDAGLARGSLQLIFDGSDMMLFDLRTGTVSESHGFATDGVHHYGEFTAIASDGNVVATTLENEAYAFLYYADEVENNPPPWGNIVYSSFGGGTKRLLEVVAGEAVLAIPGETGVEIVSRDIDPAPASEDAAKATEMRVVLVGGSANLDDYVVLSHDDSRLVLSDGARLFIVKMGSQEPVTPLVLTEQGASSCP